MAKKAHHTKKKKHQGVNPVGKKKTGSRNSSVPQKRAYASDRRW